MKRGVVKLELNRKDSINFTLRMPVDLRLELEKNSQKRRQNCNKFNQYGT